jgi:hypothetical protein
LHGNASEFGIDIERKAGIRSGYVVFSQIHVRHFDANVPRKPETAEYLEARIFIVAGRHDKTCRVRAIIADRNPSYRRSEIASAFPTGVGGRHGTKPCQQKKCTDSQPVPFDKLHFSPPR